MRILVTGATGNVGTAVVRALVADTAVDEVVGIVRRRPSAPPEGVTFHTADVATDDLVPLLKGAQAVVHLAWLFQPTHTPEITWRANAVGTERVLRAAAEGGVGAVVQASLVGAYSRSMTTNRGTSRGPPTACPPPGTAGRRRTPSGCLTSSPPRTPAFAPSGQHSSSSATQPPPNAASSWAPSSQHP